MSMTEAEAVLHKAMAQSTMLRRAFHLCASRRADASQWQDLEDAAAAHLEERAVGPGQVQAAETQWFGQVDGRLRMSVLDMLSHRASASSRASHCRRAMDELYASAAGWAPVLGEATAAYWRHAGLMWMALWHAADMPGITAGLFWQCLDSAFAPVPAAAPALERASRKAVGARLLGAAGSIATVFRNAR